MIKINIILEYSEYIKNIQNKNINDDFDIYNKMKTTKIVEGLIRTVDNTKSLEIILRRFNELNGNIEKDGEIYLVGDFKELYNYIPLFNNLGYFISIITINGKEWLKDFDNNIIPVALYLEPKYDYKISNNPEKLYHVSLEKNLNRILKVGLVPRTNSKLTKHPERIYLTDDKNVAYSFGIKMIEDTDLKFIIFEILNTKNIKLFSDINMRENGFYTLCNISKDNIKLIYKN